MIMLRIKKAHFLFIFSDVLENGANVYYIVRVTILTVTEDKNENGWDE